MKKQSRTMWAVLLAVLLITACAHAQQFSDWGAPVNLGPVVNSAFNEERPAISKDGLSLYFSSTKPEFGGTDLYVSQRASLEDPWEPPLNLGPNINTSGDESAPNLSTNGHWLFFHRPGFCGGLDLHVAHRKDRRDDAGWEPAMNLDLVGRDPGGIPPCIVNSSVNDAGPNYFQDETTGVNTLIFTSLNRPGNIGNFDIYSSTQNPDGTFAAAVLVPVLSSPGRDTRTAIRRRDGLELYLVSERPPGAIGDANIWVSTRPDTSFSWSTPVLLSQAPLLPGELPINIIGPVPFGLVFDGAMGLSWDGTELYFHSNRPGGSGGHDLYLAKRHKLTGNNP